MQTNGYEFSSAPRSVTNKRSKFRENGKPQNIMYDKRVYRGSSYSTREESIDAPSPTKKVIKAAKADPNESLQQRPVTPPPVDGRMHMDIQTDNYLEELSDRNPEVDMETQTDALLDLHPPILFIPMPSGIDASTQIENGDLFDFDLEVEPILEVLVGKTLEIGLLETLEENELRDIRQRQEIFEQARNAELAEVQRLEAEAKRKYAEKQRRLDEEKRRVRAQAELEEKVAARSFAKNYLSDLHTKVFDLLVGSGHFYDLVEKDVKEKFLPTIVQEATASVERLALARKLLDSLIIDTLQRGA